MQRDDKQRREQLYKLLGDLPVTDRAVADEVGSVEERGTYRLEKLRLQLNGAETVPAYFVKPLGAEGPVPTVLFHHSHGGRYQLGKDELLDGNTYLYDEPYADALTRMGYAVLCIDAWGFGERSGRTESELFKDMLWHGQSLWGMMVYDALRAFDYLTTRPDVDASRIGTMGMSMGSTMAWWLAALELRCRVCVDLCCLTDYQVLQIM